MPFFCLLFTNVLLLNDVEGLVFCSFTWVLYERGELTRYFEGDDVPGYALYTATWGLIVPHLAEAYPGNRKMGMQVRQIHSFHSFFSPGYLD